MIYPFKKNYERISVISNLKILCTLTLSIALNSCFFYKKDGVEIKIKNDSEESITNVEFTTTEKLKSVRIDEVQANSSVSEFLSMRNNKTDGAYLLTFTRADGTKEVKSEGYYTNGSSLNHWIDVIVKNDTTIVKFDAPIY